MPTVYDQFGRDAGGQFGDGRPRARIEYHDPDHKVRWLRPCSDLVNKQALFVGLGSRACSGHRRRDSGECQKKGAGFVAHSVTAGINHRRIFSSIMQVGP